MDACEAISIHKRSIVRIKLTEIPFSLNQTSIEMQWNIIHLLSRDGTCKLQTKERKWHCVGKQPCEQRSVGTFCCLHLGNTFNVGSSHTNTTIWKKIQKINHIKLP